MCFENKQHKMEGVDGVMDVSMDIPGRDKSGELHAEMIQSVTQERIQECVSRDIFDVPVPRVMEETIEVVKPCQHEQAQTSMEETVEAIRLVPVEQLQECNVVASPRVHEEFVAAIQREHAHDVARGKWQLHSKQQQPARQAVQEREEEEEGRGRE